MKRVIYIIAVFVLTGCSDFLKEYSQDLVVAKSVADLDEVLIGSAYLPSIEIKNYVGAGTGCCPWLNVLDDDVITIRDTVRGVSSLDGWNSAKSMYGYFAWQYEVGQNIKKTGKAADDNTWNDLYARINVVNVILAELDELDINTDKEKLDVLRVKGECHFLRAQFYLVLVNLYADAYSKETAMTKLGVPLKLTGYVEHDKDKDTQFDRAPVARVYGQILEDLKLSIGYLAESPQKRPLHRASKESAQLLLSRVYLYMQDWENARIVAEDFLKNKDVLTMMEGFDAEAPFLSRDNGEVVFSQGTLNAQKLIRGEIGDFGVSKDLYQLYDTLQSNRDLRVDLFFQKNIYNDSTGIGRKYKSGVHISHVSDLFCLRTAEAYLNMAEACAMLNDADANNWLNDLRRTRIRNYRDAVYSGRELVDQVRLERRKELCFEGHRWFDLRRYAVNTEAPFKKQIVHDFVVYNDENRNLYSYTLRFILLEDDPAYTFRIPESVLEFDKGMPDNPRPKRDPVKDETPEIDKE